MKWWKILPFSMAGALASAIFPRAFDRLDNAIGNVGNSLTGSGLTDAEKEANQFTAGMQERQYELQREARQTEFQDKTQSMLSAGLNPAMMYGGTSQGTQTVQTTSGSSVSPSGSGAAGIGALMNIVSTGASVRSALAKAKLDEEVAKNQEFERKLTDAQTRYQDSMTTLNNKRIELGLPKLEAENISADTRSKDSVTALNKKREEVEEQTRILTILQQDRQRIENDWLPKINQSVVAYNNAKSDEARSAAKLNAQRTITESIVSGLQALRFKYMKDYNQEMPVTPAIISTAVGALHAAMSDDAKALMAAIDDTAVGRLVNGAVDFVEGSYDHFKEGLAWLDNTMVGRAINDWFN